MIRQWIAEGAVSQPHWAFVPLPGSVAVPAVNDRKWPRNEIDQFILARLEAEGLKPSAEADKARWLRRVTYDLTGLPPTPEELAAFVGDKSTGAYEIAVDRLLASPRYGERMAVPWLDAARYADSYGYQSDQLCPTWPYRDWVVGAFNRNLPYDRFLVEQLAGDLLPNPTREQRLATAFNRLHRQTNEGGSIEKNGAMSTSRIECIHLAPRFWHSPSNAPAATTTSSTRSYSATTTVSPPSSTALMSMAFTMIPPASRRLRCCCLTPTRKRRWLPPSRR